MPTTDIPIVAIWEAQYIAFEQWQRTLEGEQEWQQAAANDLVTIAEQQACVQRYGLELTRALVHMGGINTAIAVPSSDTMAEPVHTAIDAQFDGIRLLQDTSLAAVRTVFAPVSEHSASVDEPVTIDVESGTEPSAEVKTAGETESRAEDATVEYATFVEGTVAEVKERVETEDVNIEHVIASERAGDARVTLLEWLERQLVAQKDE